MVQVVDADHGLAAAEESFGDVESDETGDAGDENGHPVPSLLAERPCLPEYGGRICRSNMPIVEVAADQERLPAEGDSYTSHRRGVQSRPRPRVPVQVKRCDCYYYVINVVFCVGRWHEFVYNSGPRTISGS